MIQINLKNGDMALTLGWLQILNHDDMWKILIVYPDMPYTVHVSFSMYFT